MEKWKNDKINKWTKQWIVNNVPVHVLNKQTIVH